MKKILIALLATVCLVCLGLAAACEKEQKYYKLTFEAESCVEVISEAKSGASVLAGYEVSFTLKVAEGAEGELSVTVNGNKIQANSDNVYSFKITEDTVVEITGVSVPGEHTVKFDTEGDDWVKFTDAEGNELKEVSARSGDTINFKVKESVYYGHAAYNEDGTPVYTVRKGSQIVPCVNGAYSITVTGDTTVKISGLPTDLGPYTFLGRKDGGKGTAESPFSIKYPIDLYAMADMIADEFNQGSELYQTAVYKLENDIDLGGEKLYVIGDATTQLSVFAGTFDGNHKTISNYVMTDTLPEQENMTSVHLPFVGLFGNAVTAGIYNLSLKDFKVDVEGSEGGSVFAGGIVGYGRGVDISNCSVTGADFTVNGDVNRSSFVGGIIGAQESMQIEDVNYYSFVRNCNTDVNLVAASGYVYAVGGITGYLYTGGETTTSAILNCYAKGDISGAVRAGGICGQLTPYSSVKNCYATGHIEAANDINVTTGVEQLSRAYAGGIAGYAEHDSIVSNSFFTGQTYASAVAGASFEFRDGLVAGRDDAGTMYVHTRAAIVLDSYSETDKSVYGNHSGIDDAFIKNTLKWSAADWTFAGDGMPVINKEETEKTFTITVKSGDNTLTTLEVNADLFSGLYISMSYWHAIENGLPQFIGEGMRTFGYFFDKELTLKVPFGYVPTENMTLYAQYADYGKVAGEYYLDGGAYLSLNKEGIYFYRKGAMEYGAYYTFDGDKLVLQPSPAFEIATSVMGEDALVTENVYVGATADYSDDGNFVFNYKYVDTLNNHNKSLTALKSSADFRYGTYRDANSVLYTFNKDGTGVMKNASVSTPFTFAINGDTLTVKMGATLTGTIENGVVTQLNGTALTAFDKFAGTWEKSFGSYKNYTFDGNGNWTYEYFGYGKNGEKVVKESGNGTYTAEGEAIRLDNGVTARFEDGALVVGGEKYYRQNSFVGTWRFGGRPDRNEQIEITFAGIGENGYGVANVKYFPTFYGEIQLNYEVSTEGGSEIIILYYGMEEYGRLTFNRGAKTLTGTFYSAVGKTEIKNALFCLYDDYKGVWNNEELGTVEFNGLGNYAVAGSPSNLPVNGNVKINGVSAGAYTLTDGTLTGWFNYNGERYEIEYDELSGVIKAVCGDKEYTLVKSV